MSIELTSLFRVAITKESAANFATDLTGSATYLDVPVVADSVSLSLEKDELDTGVVQQYIDALPLRVLGRKRATLSFSVPLHPTGTAAGDGTDSAAETDNALIQLLAIAMGGIDAENAGTTFSAVTDEDTWSLTSSTGFSPGGVIGWADSNGVLHARELSSTTAPKIAFPSAPSVSDVAYAGTTLYLGDDPTDTVQVIFESREEDDRWLLLGGQCTTAPTISLELGSIPTIQFTWTFADWQSLSSSAISTAMYSNYDPQVIVGGTGYGLRAQVAGTTTLQSLDVSAVEWGLAAPVHQEVPSPSGTNGIARWRRSRVVPAAEPSITLPFEDTSWWTERDDRDRYHLEYQIGAAAGSAVLLTIPNAQVVNPQKADADGIMSQTVQFVSTIDANATNQSTALRRSAFRVHFL